MSEQAMSRRSLLAQSGGVLAGLALADIARAYPARAGETLVPWIDQPPPSPNPAVANLRTWEELDSWITPEDRFFNVAHFDRQRIKGESWRLAVGGLVDKPLVLSLADLKARPRQDVVFTLECSGNHGFPWFATGIGTARWAGAPLAPLLKQAGVHKRGIEVVFYGSDSGEGEAHSVDGVLKVKQHFARSMSIEDAMNPHNILCFEMNGRPLPQVQGFPVRLIAPGWYGIANVKWLSRIEVLDTRFMGNFMAKDYVTLREERHGEETVWTQTSVGRTLLKSAPARVMRKGDAFRIVGAAWGAPIKAVQVRIDDGPWQAANIDPSKNAEFAWKFWDLDWKAAAGEHAITSRAIDITGKIQPAPDDPRLTGKRTYWESNGQVTRRVRV